MKRHSHVRPKRGGAALPAKVPRPASTPAVDIDIDANRRLLNRYRFILHEFERYSTEMLAAETVAQVIYSLPGMPWEFQFDSARHLYDEVRHCLMGYEGPIEGVRLLIFHLTLSQLPKLELEN